MYEKSVVVVSSIGLVLLVAAASGPRAASGAGKAKPGESIIVYEEASFEEQGPVEFSHPAHKEAYGEKVLNCKPCHMTPPIVFPMKRKAGEDRQIVTMKEMEAGKGCGTCHNGKTTVNETVVFSVVSEEDCGKCHKKK